MPEAEERRRRLEQAIVDYLDSKAKSSKVTELWSSKAYASIEEISLNLNCSASDVGNLVEELLQQSKIKAYPLRKGKKKYYGSNILPRIEKDEDSAAAVGKAKGNSTRLCAPDVRLTNLVFVSIS